MSTVGGIVFVAYTPFWQYIRGVLNKLERVYISE